MTELQSESNPSIVNTHFSETDKSNRQEINKDIND